MSLQLTEALFDYFVKNIPGHESQLKALRLRENDAINFAEQIIGHGLISRDEVGEMLATAIGHTYVGLSKSLVQKELIERFSEEMARGRTVIPLYQMGNIVTVAMAEPYNADLIRVVENSLGARVSPVFSFPVEIESAVKVYFQSARDIDKLLAALDFQLLEQSAQNESRLKALAESRQMVTIADALVLLALKDRASDIHIETKRNGLSIRFRVDGVLLQRFLLPREMASPLISTFKIRASLDITESRRPQDGRLSFELPSKRIDLRVSSLPLLHGEKLVLRILGTAFNQTILNLEKLDFSPAVLGRMKNTLKQTAGILFVTGPTGSGKTTSLYAALNHINKADVNIITIEDPVEYEIHTLNQVAVNEKVGRGFPEVLRAVLRQDPDVILVGEIRDPETAHIATQAALTGHLVLTTLHTNTALQATTRLIDMGVERFMVAPAILGVLNQRLARKLCSHCKQPYPAEPRELAPYFHFASDSPLPTLYRARGCEHCNGTGFIGRLGIHEFLLITPALREAIQNGASVTDLQKLAQETGYQNMRHDGLKKVLRGLTTLEEMLRVTTSDSE